MGEVESAIAAPASGREEPWRLDLASKLEGLADALDWHIAGTEGPDGLLTEILLSAPRLAHRLSKARADHVALRAAVDEARSAVSASADASLLRDQVVELLAHLARHRQLGSDLVYEAYSVDIEAGD
jgi:hypothetical protein